MPTLRIILKTFPLRRERSTTKLYGHSQADAAFGHCITTQHLGCVLPRWWVGWGDSVVAVGGAVVWVYMFGVGSSGGCGTVALCVVLMAVVVMGMVGGVVGGS